MTKAPSAGNLASVRGFLVLAAAVLACTVLAFTGLQAQEARYAGLDPDRFMRRWLVLGPIPIGEAESPDAEAQRAAFDSDRLAEAGGESGVQPAEGKKVDPKGRSIEWRRLDSPADHVDLRVGKASRAHSITYAWAEIEVPERTRGLLGLGSDDGLKVWLNGKLVHRNWTARPVLSDDDLVPVELEPGRNRLLLKVQNQEGPSGFACRFLGPAAQAERLTDAAGDGDLEELKLLLDRGLDVNCRDRSGLTALQAARLRGQKESAELLLGRGADPRVELPPREALVDSLLSGLVEPGGSGAAVLVSRDGRILFEKAYGLASIEHRVPATPRTRFRIGSISKQFIAAAILKLAEEGRLRVEDKLSRFIPDYPRGDEVTVHHLLTHTSGIHSYTAKPDFIREAPVGVETEEHIKSFKDDPYDFDPGKKWAYNNSGYFLLGHIIEKVAGVPYGDYLRATFFEPLSMRDTGVHQASAIIPDEATGYSFEDGTLRKAINWDMSKAGGAGSLYSTVGDLHRWNEALFAGHVLKESTLKAAFTPVAVEGEDRSEAREEGYGYGFAIQRLRGRPEIGHGGGLNGFLSYLLRLPEERFTVAVLVNCAPPPPDQDPSRLARRITELYLGDRLPPREAPVDPGVPEEALQAIVGRYDYGQGILTVTREGRKLFAQLSGQERHQIFPRSANEFFWKVVEAEVKFTRDEKGRVIQAVHRQGGQSFTAPRLEDLEAVKVDSRLYDAYAGRYDYGGGKAIMAVTREGDRLFAQLTGQPRFEIFPKSETEFFWKAVNARVTFVKDSGGKVRKAVHEQGGRKFDAPRMD